MGAYDANVHYAFEDFEVDLATYEVRRGGEPVHLQPLIFDLLVHLLQNRDRMVSYAELNQRVWDNSLVSAAAARQAVSVLRRVLDDDGRNQRLVRNVSKRGYRFVGDVTESDAMPAPIEVTTMQAAYAAAM
jgi:DNA-binding winged helix-turn-helix (wHTH) protein